MIHLGENRAEASRSARAHRVGCAEVAAAVVPDPTEVDAWIWTLCSREKAEEDVQEATPTPTLSRHLTIQNIFPTSAADTVLTTMAENALTTHRGM